MKEAHGNFFNENVLSCYLSSLVAPSKLLPISSPRDCATWTHLLYIDDVLLFCRGTSKNIFIFGKWCFLFVWKFFKTTCELGKVSNFVRVWHFILIHYSSLVSLICAKGIFLLCILGFFFLKGSPILLLSNRFLIELYLKYLER